MKSYHENFNNNSDIHGEIDPKTLHIPQLDNLETSITKAEEEIIINKTKIFYGVLLVIGIGISWSASTQFAQHVQVRTSVKIPPFALMWFGTSFKIFCFIPLIITYFQNEYKNKQAYMDLSTPESVTNNQKKFNPFSSHSKHTKISEIFNAEEYDDEIDSQYGTTNSALSASSRSVVNNKNSNGIKQRISNSSSNSVDAYNNYKYMFDVTPNTRKMCMLYILFYCLWTGANYCYLRALDSNSATIVTALFSSNNMFIYVLSIFILNEIFSWLRMFSVVTAILGIVFIALNNKNNSIVLAGSVLAIFSSIFAAIYKVYFKKIFGYMHVLSVCKFLGFIGLFNALFMWIVIVILQVTELEILPFNEPIHKWPWGFLIGSAVCGLIFDFLINFGIAFTYPLFIALGIIIGIPINLTADIIFNKLIISSFEMIGVVCICVGFLIIVLTDLHGKGNNASFRK